MRNAILKRDVNLADLQKADNPAQDEEHDYEIIILKKSCANGQPYGLPEILQHNHDYSLVSEVYVNNGYNYGSAPSSLESSPYPSMEKHLNLGYENGTEKPGKLLIEVQDCADHYIPVHESDSFEPDTLDRKSSIKKNVTGGEYSDSLERPTQILLRSTGSFRNEQLSSKRIENEQPSKFNRIFGSLREIYEAKTKRKNQEINFDILKKSFAEGRILTLEDRHSKRQRMKDPPDLIPPPPYGNSLLLSSIEGIDKGNYFD